MLKFEKTAEIGDLIKAYDFQPMSDRGDSYIVGKVTDKGMANGMYMAYTVDVELMSESELLWALLGAMETPEIRENWEYIKRCHDLDDLLYGKPEDQGKYDRECFV